MPPSTEDSLIYTYTRHEADSKVGLAGYSTPAAVLAC